jgi:hypothetical protein
MITQIPYQRLTRSGREYCIMYCVKFTTAFFADYYTYLHPLVNGLWYIWNSLFMALIKMGFIMDQFGWKLELPEPIQWIRRWYYGHMSGRAAGFGHIISSFYFLINFKKVLWSASSVREYERLVFGISSVCTPPYSLNGWAGFIHIQYLRTYSS